MQRPTPNDEQRCGCHHCRHDAPIAVTTRGVLDEVTAAATQVAHARWTTSTSSDKDVVFRRHGVVGVLLRQLVDEQVYRIASVATALGPIVICFDDVSVTTEEDTTASVSLRIAIYGLLLAARRPDPLWGGAINLDFTRPRVEAIPDPGTWRLDPYWKCLLGDAPACWWQCGSDLDCWAMCASVAIVSCMIATGV